MQAREGGGEGLRPRPGAWQAQLHPARVAGDPPGDVQQAVPEALGLAGGEIRAGEQQPPCPGEQIDPDEHELQPGRVHGIGAEGQATQPARLGAADGVFNGGALAMYLLEARDALALLVREHDLEAVTIGIAEGELGAGVRTLTAADRPRALRPGREVEGKRGHPGALAGIAA